MSQHQNRTQELSTITIWAAMLAAAALLTGLLIWLWRMRGRGDNIQPIHIDLSFIRPPQNAAAPASVPTPYPARSPQEPTPQPVPTPLPVKDAAPVTGAGEPDDLTTLFGVGPKIARVLKAAGIDTYTRLAQADPQALLDILQAAGMRLSDPASWPEQARLAAAGQWDEMKAYIARLRTSRN